MALKAIENEFSVNAPWGKISGLTWGDQYQPPILVVHGKLDVCTGFRPLISLLPKRFFYVAIDLPGNGRSDALPKGVRYTVLDLVPTIEVVRKHYGWQKFIYMGHSLGTLIGKYYNIAFPGFITRAVELDPVPAHHNWDTSRESLASWYHAYYGSYDAERYHKFYAGTETAPRYSYEKAQEMIMKTRNMTKEGAENILERCLEPVGDNLYRFTYDQRMKEVTVLPYSGEILRTIYTAATTPTLAVLAQGEIDRGMYDGVPFVKQEHAWPNGNYKCIVVNGSHDVHISNPERMSNEVAKFLMEHFKSKL